VTIPTPGRAIGNLTIGEGRHFHQLLEWIVQSGILAASEHDLFGEKKR
jgi:hypothetical protein